MKRHDPDQPIGNLHVIPDFLPPPEELFPKREGVKITLIVDKESVDFFRNRAHQAGLKYQGMIRAVLREYSYRYGQHSLTKRSSRHQPQSSRRG